MKKNSTIETMIFLVIGFIVLSFAIKICLSLVGGLIGIAFRFGIPLLIAVVIVRLLTNRANRRRY